MGVSGAGKSTVGAALAQRLSWRFIEADDYHSESSWKKMERGEPLDDDDRRPWLARLAAELQAIHVRGESAVLACSALKRRYRDRLRLGSPSARFVFLDLPPSEAAKRVGSRSGHFMPDSLVASQFADLEPPVAEHLTLRVDATRSLDAIVDQALDWHASRDTSIERDSAVLSRGASLGASCIHETNSSF